MIDSVVMFDRETQKPRGFGFVTFADASICRRLLHMGKTLSEDSSIDEKENDDYEEDNPTNRRSGLLEMRGKIIEVKVAQPKEQPLKQATLFSAAQTPNASSPVPAMVHAMDNRFQHNSQQYPYGSGPYDHIAKHSATLPQWRHPSTFYGFSAPPTPVPYFADPMTPVSPQAAFDMTHHMMFYSHLLATPTLMSSPMMSPMVLGYDHQHHYSSHFYPFENAYPEQGTTASAPPAPDVSKSPAVPIVPENRYPFRIGGATFYPEEPSSPTLQHVEPSVREIPPEKREIPAN